MKMNEYRKNYDTDDAIRLFLYVLLIPYLAVFVLYMIYTFIGTSINMDLDVFNQQLPVVLINAVFMQLCFVAIYFAFNYKRKINFITASKLDKKPNYLLLMIAICMGFAVMWFTSPLMTLFEEGLTAIGFDVRQDLGFKLDNAGTIIYAFLALAILPAFMEEFIFRGAILQGLRKYGDWFAILGSALLFMLIHANIQQTIYQFGFGILAGWLVIKTGSIWTSIAIHAINNGVIILMQTLQDCGVMTAGTTGVDGALIISAVVEAVILVLILWLGIYLINKISKKQEKPIECEVALAETAENKSAKSKNAKTAKNNGGVNMTLKSGTKAFFSDKYQTRYAVISIFVSLCFLIINSVAMLK